MCLKWNTKKLQASELIVGVGQLGMHSRELEGKPCPKLSTDESNSSKSNSGAPSAQGQENRDEVFQSNRVEEKWDLRIGICLLIHTFILYLLSIYR